MGHSEPLETMDPDPYSRVSYLFAWWRPPDQLTAMSQAWVLSSVAACMVAPVYLRQQTAGLQSGSADHFMRIRIQLFTLMRIRIQFST